MVHSFSNSCLMFTVSFHFHPQTDVCVETQMRAETRFRHEEKKSRVAMRPTTPHTHVPQSTLMPELQMPQQWQPQTKSHCRSGYRDPQTLLPGRQNPGCRDPNHISRLSKSSSKGKCDRSSIPVSVTKICCSNLTPSLSSSAPLSAPI